MTRMARRQDDGMDATMAERVGSANGFIAALDQSGGSTPKALALYGVPESAYSTEEEMFDQVHAMRSRIMTSPAFTGERILGAILFEGTMDRQVEGMPTATFLWQEREVVPFLKVDQGLADEVDGVQLMKPIPDLEALLDRAVANGVFGTKMRSVIKRADAEAIEKVVAQQFEIGARIRAKGLVPIIEPEVDINAPDKAEAEALLRDAILRYLDTVPDGPAGIMLKLTIPDVDDFYAPLIAHPRILRVVALSGGYPRDDANARLSRNHGMIASFSRALADGLHADHSADEFDTVLAASIESIYAASIT
jgi:fructose-bisphosphate aldolase class I